MMSAAVFWLAAVALCAPSSNSPLERDNVVQIQDDSLQQSFIDQLYGDIIRTEESEAYRAGLVVSGEIQAAEAIEPTFLSYDKLISSPHSLMRSFEEIKASHEKNTRLAAHSGYLRSRGKLTLPHDDDTEDLTSANLFGGILTFGGFPTLNCFDPGSFSSPIDIAIVGAPFDTGTSYRPGARFGPEAIRMGARRLGNGITPVRGTAPGSKLGTVDPYDPSSHNLSIVDCGDVPMTPFDNRIALNQLYRGHRAIHNHTTTGAHMLPYTKVLTMGGDHTITLMALRSAYEKYGQLAVLHFDSHIDTWDPKVLGGGLSDYMSLNHGTFLHYAAENGYLLANSSFHVGLRAPYISPDYDRKHDRACGFSTITARDMDKMGISQIVETLKTSLGDTPVYISVDIDVLDPAFAPGTGTMESGGWTTRELLSVLDGLEGLNVVGGDVVEVSPPYDTNSEITSLAATAVMDSLLGLLIVQTLK
ncbi:hypothetical protein OXX79_003729 [Metschnikowia pulcherrima]